MSWISRGRTHVVKVERIVLSQRLVVALPDSVHELGHAQRQRVVVLDGRLLARKVLIGREILGLALADHRRDRARLGRVPLDLLAVAKAGQRRGGLAGELLDDRLAANGKLDRSISTHQSLWSAMTQLGARPIR